MKHLSHFLLSLVLLGWVSGCQSEGPSSKGDGELVFTNPADEAHFNIWETFDNQRDNYNPDAQNTIASDFFRRRIKGIGDGAGLSWSSEIPSLDTQGGVMKSWVDVQNPARFEAGTQFRADLEPKLTWRERGWEVYDETLPQTRAYSFAFTMPKDFTYSTYGNRDTDPGAIENDGYNWIIAQWLDFASPVTPPYAIHMRGKDLLFREKIYLNWYTIEEDVDAHFQRGEWIVFLAIVDWTFGNEGSFVLFYDWIDPASPEPTDWKEVARLTGNATMHPEVQKRATPMMKLGGYYWLLKQAKFNERWWDENVGVDRRFIMYYDFLRGITLQDPRFEGMKEEEIKDYFSWKVE